VRALLILVALSACSPSTAPKPPLAERSAAPPSHSALVLVIDRSGSMQGGKLSAALDASAAAARTLAPDDTVAVVGFDSEARVLAAPQPAGDRERLVAELALVKAGGGTNIVPGLREAYAILHATAATTRHVILLSDGEAPNEGLSALIQQMRGEHITISTVAVEGADEQLLEQISKDGGGRMYKVTDLKGLSQTFVKETQLALAK
jgi:uncharacterized protein with von Willebrand factor type A (vWA) domain